MSARQLDLALRAGPGAAGDLPRRARLRAARSGRVRAPSLREALGRRRALRHRQRRLSRRQQPAPREALPRVGLRHHAGLQPVRGRTRLLRRARQGRFPRPRRAGRRQGRRAEAEAHVVYRAARDQPLRRRNRAGGRARAGPRHERRVRLHRRPQPAVRLRRRHASPRTPRTRSKRWASAIPRCVTRGRCTIPTAARFSPRPSAARSPRCPMPLRRSGADLAALLDLRRDGHGMPRAFYLDAASLRGRDGAHLAARLALRRVRVRDPESRRFPDAHRRHVARARDPRRRRPRCARSTTCAAIAARRSAGPTPATRARSSARITAGRIRGRASSSPATGCRTASTSRRWACGRCTPRCAPASSTFRSPRRRLPSTPSARDSKWPARRKASIARGSRT